MKLNKLIRGKLIALFALTGIFASFVFSVPALAQSPETKASTSTSGRQTQDPRTKNKNGSSPNETITTSSTSERSPKGSSVEQKDDEEDDADVPRFMIGKIAKEEYLRRRDEHIKRLRGIEKGKPFDPGARGRAIRQLDQQSGLTDKNTLTIRLGATNGAGADTEVSSGGVIGSPEASASLTNSVWKSVGPAPIPNGQTSGETHAVSGRVTAIAVHPANPDIFYVGTAQGGIYRTLDGGATWTAIFDNAQTLAVGSIAIAPSQPSTIYVGTGEGNFGCDTYFGVGVYRIDNADGTTPVMTGPFNQRSGDGADVLTGRSISKVLVHPTNPDIIFLAVNNGGVGGIGCNFSATQTNPRGLYRSTNATSGNATFEKVTMAGVLNGGDRSVTDIEFEPGNPNTILTTVRGGGSSGDDGGVYRSANALDAAPSFTRTLATASSALYRTEITINKVGSAVTVFAATTEADGTVKRSTDGGITWSAALSNVTGFCGAQCDYDMPIAVDPNNANVLYVGGNADNGSTPATAVLKKSTNALAATPTFARAQRGLHADSHVIEVHPSNSSLVYTGNDGGVWRSTDAATTWTSLNNIGFNATQFQSVAVHPIDPNYTIGGTQDNGTERMRPDGTWTRTDYGDGGFALIDQSATNTTTVRQYHTYFNQTGTATSALMGFATTTSSTAFENWGFYGCGGTANGISCNDSAVLFYAPMALGPGTPNTLYYGTDKIYRSTNSGVNMSAVSQQFASGVAVSAVGISRQNDSVRIVGLENGKVFRTMTGATTMNDVTGTIPAKYVSRAVIDPNNVNTAYVTLAGFFGNSTPHIYKTTNLNSATPTWTGIGGNIPDIPVNAFIVDPADSNMLYAGTDVGVYRSIDGGATWAAFSNGLPRVAVFDMAIQNSNRILRIATHGRGMWDISVDVNANPATLQGSVTDASTGNPIGGATVTAGSNAVTTDVNGFYQFSEMAAGTYTVTVSASGYSNGTANVTLTSGGTSTQNFPLTAAPVAACLTDTSQANFQAGTANSVDLTTSPGDVKLASSAPVVDQQVTTQQFFEPLSTTQWRAQTFRAGISGQLTKVDLRLQLVGTAGTVGVELRNVVNGLPGATVLASASTSVSNTAAANYSIEFPTPATVSAGTNYAIVVRALTGGTYNVSRVGNDYANGAFITTTNSGSSWASSNRDMGQWKTYVSSGFVSSGSLVSEVKDSNPAAGNTARWTTLSWTAAIPANTTVKYQVAGSNNAVGPFNFVGPDGTANTYFTTSGASLSQFNGFRYLKYKAYLNTTNSAVTPALNDVQVCFNNSAN